MPKAKGKDWTKVNMAKRRNILTREELDTLHFASLRILSNTGILVEDKEAADLFQSFGARVEPTRNNFKVYIPQFLVDDALSWAPKTVTFFGRDPKNDFVAEAGGQVGFASFGECVSLIDPATRKYRPTTKEDCGKTALVVDALDELRIMTRTVCSGDQYPDAQPVHNFEALVNNTSKHIFLGVGSKSNLETMVAIAHEVCGGETAFRARPIFTATACLTSPLTIVDQCCETIMTAARNGVGIQLSSMPLTGGSAPATLGGTVIQHNCEILSGLVLAQLSQRGTRCLYATTASLLELKSGHCIMGPPENGLLSSTLAQVAHYYQLPIWTLSGASDAKIPDAQVGYEYTINALQAALAGANIIVGSGALNAGLCFDYAKLLMDHECMGNIQRVLKGVALDEILEVAELINEVGPAGFYLTHRHTLQRVRSQSKAELFDRQSLEVWAKKNPNNRSIVDRAYDMANNILTTHKPLPLPPGAAETIQEMVKTYEASLKKGKA